MSLSTILIDNGDGTTTLCHQWWIGDKGPFIAPVGDTFQDDSPSPVTLETVPLQTSGQILIGSAPTQANNVLRKADSSAGTLTEVVIGTGSEKRFRIRWEESSYSAVREIWTGSAWTEIGRWDLSEDGSTPITPTGAGFDPASALERIPYFPGMTLMW